MGQIVAQGHTASIDASADNEFGTRYAARSRLTRDLRDGERPLYGRLPEDKGRCWGVAKW